ncbi:hypothetical protein PDIG_27600 [Penicillium digitatum PHI26]|uniref:Uncharacterized protein n=2 Tax=Penicillium digitatum TaxID=36651 RepID=K9FZX2_PEND2|nr:hypothetical protein PDIP_62040 [Penicillium digitatum Pd1]EKV09980.1 hypothetical protein PDIP_62040 [Penicillium digitatum Pd1]EKV15230.1 hypothetical protein PDIG_27600 [Penicillium digitatum PHI26]
MGIKVPEKLINFPQNRIRSCVYWRHRENASALGNSCPRWPKN